MTSPQRAATPAGLVAATSFFVAAGLLEIAMALWETRPLAFWPVWDASARGSLHFLLAWGLWRRIALCRSLAMVYCLAALVMYPIVVGFALAGAPFSYPPSVVAQSLLQFPSCALLYPYLRSARASRIFTRPLLG